ncbi:hypothetical protein YN1_6340 [Nanoarchaeota archaeon]
MLGIYGTVYNSADTVRQTIEDLKSKLKEDFILVVTDNYSTDDTYEILKEYDFIDTIRAKSTRGKGRQIALQHLIKNYPEVDFIFYIDFDLEFPDYLQKMIDGIKKRYEFGEFYANIASYDTYKDAIKKVIWPDMNVGEDYYWYFSLIKNKYLVYRLCFPTAFNQIREKREKKYAKGLKYIKRQTNNLFEWYFLQYLKSVVDISSFSIVKYFENNITNIFPEDLNLDKDLLFLMFKTSGEIYDSVKKALRGHKGKYKFLYFRSKSRILKYATIIRNDKNEYVNKMLKYFENFFNES